MTSASTGSKFIIERSNDSNMNNINTVSMKDPRESESVSCPTSDQKESREHCSMQNGWTPLAKLEVQHIPWMKDFGMTLIDWTQFRTGVWTMISVIIGHITVKI